MVEGRLPADEGDVGERERRVKSRLAYGRLTWQGLGNASIHMSIVTCIVYAAVIAAALVGRPELRYSIAHFA